MNKIFKLFIDMGVGTIFYILISGCVTPIITRIVSPDVFGDWSLFVAYGTMMSNVLLLGLDQAFIRFYYCEKSNYYTCNLLKECIRYPLLISVIALLISFFLYQYGIHKNLHSIFFFMYILLRIPITYMITLFRMQYDTFNFTLFRSLDRGLIVLVFLFILEIGNISTDYGLIVSTVLASSLVVIIGFILQRRVWKNVIINNIVKCKKISFKELIYYALPLMITIIVSSALSLTDRTTIKIFKDAYELGIYSAAVSIVNVFVIIQMTFTSVWMPLAIEHYEKGNSDIMFYTTANRAITSIMVVFGLVVLLLKDLLIYFVGPEYVQAKYLITPLSFYPVLYTISETTVCGIVFSKKSIYQVYVAVCSLIVNLVLDILLVPQYGSMGAAWSTAFTYVVFLLLRTIFSQRLYKINYDLKRMVLYIILYMCVCIFDFYLIESIYTNVMCIGVICFLFFEERKYLLRLIKCVFRKQ